MMSDVELNLLYGDLSTMKLHIFSIQPLKTVACFYFMYSFWEGKLTWVYLLLTLSWIYNICWQNRFENM